jgi:glycosyltransferase involved in cell wall biosynthesis
MTSEPCPAPAFAATVQTGLMALRGEVMTSRGRRVLIIVQNLPVPLDRRVWLEAKALVSSGFGVSVICPKGPGDPAFQEIEGVRIYKYPPPPEARGLLGYVVEFAYCWLMTAMLSVRVLVRDGFKVIQACNPPDTYFALARIYRLLGKRFVYDQHDLNPELFVSRFGEPRGRRSVAQLRMLEALERHTYAAADHVISTNESYRQTALARGGLAPDRVTVVRSGPDTSAMRPVEMRPELRCGRAHLAVYLGVMGPQDGVDLLLEAWHRLVHERGRRDCQLALLGFGDCLEQLKAQATTLRLDDYVTFTGRADALMITEYLSTADLGVCPDPLSPLNDVSTMNKTMEYMAFALPVVSFDLKETRVSAGDSAVYVEPNDVDKFAAAVDQLLSDEAQRVRLAREARHRVAAELDWRPQEARYVEVYERFLGPAVRLPRQRQWPVVDRRRDERPSNGLRDRWGHVMVDLRRPEDLDSFIRTRHVPGPRQAPAGDRDRVTGAPTG